MNRSSPPPSGARRATLSFIAFSVPFARCPPTSLTACSQSIPLAKFAVVGCIESESTRRIIAGARYVRLPAPRTAEIALTIHDDFQRCGIGTFLLRLITQIARSDGIQFLQAEVMASNTGMLRLLQKVFPGAKTRYGTGDILHIEIALRLLHFKPSLHDFVRDPLLNVRKQIHFERFPNKSPPNPRSSSAPGANNPRFPRLFRHEQPHPLLLLQSRHATHLIQRDHPHRQRMVHRVRKHNPQRLLRPSLRQNNLPFR